VSTENAAAVSIRWGKNMRVLVLIVLGIVVLAIPILSQAPAGARPQFDVASIKVHPPPITRIVIPPVGPGRFVVEAFSLKQLVARAYSVPEVRVLGGPSWVDTERYDVDAKSESSIPQQQMSLMIRSLLEDRFQLQAHTETRALQVYELAVAKGGSKLKSSEDQTPPAPPLAPPAAGQRGGPLGGQLPRGAFTGGRGSMQGSAVPIGGLVNFLTKQLGQQVYDKTGLTGLFDFKLEWTPGNEQAPGPFGPNPDAPPPPADSSGPSIFTALQEQLGLRLESTRGPVEVVVIDSAQRLTEN
jgi:uncharacterized protein (TIGR03435 family)